MNLQQEGNQSSFPFLIFYFILNRTCILKASSFNTKYIFIIIDFDNSILYFFHIAFEIIERKSIGFDHFVHFLALIRVLFFRSTTDKQSDACALTSRISYIVFLYANGTKSIARRRFIPLY